MDKVETIDAVRAIRHAEPDVTWGLVPTMGALHNGHLALVERARAENDRVAVSIFVNPTQFNDPTDLETYPRDLEGDMHLLDEYGVDMVWVPTAEEMYPPAYQTYITVEEVTQGLEGAHRPGHFRGVATVVAKLFNVVQPQRAYFGQKDAQQVVVIQQMVRDLAIPVEVIALPIVREADGLALSSRNQRLTPEQREAALVLNDALTTARRLWQSGTRTADDLRAAMQSTLMTEPLATPDYVSVADPMTLQEIEGEAEKALLSMAVYIGEVRLIDNLRLG